MVCRACHADTGKDILVGISINQNVDAGKGFLRGVCIDLFAP